jgi:transposase
MLSLQAGTRVFVSTVPTDMRCSFEGLTHRVRSVLNEDPLSGQLFVFFNRARDRVKVLYFDRSGYAIWYKELQLGTFRVPTTRELTMVELALVLEGFEVGTLTKRKRFSLEKTIDTTTPA